MKMKVKFNGAAIKEFMLEHGEKIAFGGAVLVFAWLGYGALRRETLPADKGHDKLAAAAQAAQSHIANSEFKPEATDLKVVKYSDLTRRRPIDVADYSSGVVNNPIGDPMQKRTDPQIVALEGLRAAAGAGTFALKGAGQATAPPPGRPAGKAPPRRPARDADGEELLNLGGGRAEQGKMLAANVVIPGVRPPAGSQLKPTYWAVVTAVIPYRKQAGEYDKVFGNALGGDPARDFPQYLGYKIQRAEDDGSDPDNLKWTDINLRDVKKVSANWAMLAPEVVDPNYLDPIFSMPLGPLVGAWWTPDVGHHPEIPFAQGKMEGVDEEDGGGEEAVDEEPAEEEMGEDEFVDMADDGAGGVRRPAPGLAQVEDEDAPPVVRRPAVRQPARAPAPVASRDKKYGRDNDILLRFFDFTVQPGKSYRYRVQIGLANPNFDVKAKFIKGGEPAKKKTLLTDWSQPTAAVTVPFSDGMYARDTQRNSAKIAVYKIDEKSGLEVVTTEEFFRGGTVNFVKTVDEVVNPVSNTVESRENVAFITNAVVLDMHGGRVLDTKDKNKTTEAGEVLLIDRDGNLVVHDEMDDLPNFKAKDPKELLDGTSAQSKGAPDWGGILNEKPPKPVRTRTPRASSRTRTPRTPKVAPAPKATPAAKGSPKKPSPQTSPD